MHLLLSLPLLALLLAVSGCTGNYKYSDHEYRPLGDPQAFTRNH